VEEGLEDKMLGDLFRQKLEYGEVTPSPSLNTTIMRTVARREFFHFIPSRFNIWYAGAVLVAGTALTLILTSPPEQKIDEQIISIPSGKTITVTESGRSDNFSGVPESKPSTANPVKSGSRQIESKTASAETRLREEPSSGKSTSQASDQASLSQVSGTNVIPELTEDNNRLKGSIRSEHYIRASISQGCSPLKVSFSCLAVPCDSCSWLFGDGGFSKLKNPVWIFDVAGEYKVNLNVFSAGTKSVSSVIITVHPQPAARFEITPENAILPDDEISFHNYSDGAEKYIWDFGDGITSDLPEPHHLYRKSGNYNVRLIAISEHGCTDSVVVENAFPESGYFIEFPNAFIPNENGPSGGFYSTRSDESSQIFHPVFSGIGSYQLRIFNKGGALLFESNDISYGWDGYYKGSLCDPGVYIWKVRGNYLNGDPFTKMGDITLLKN